MLSVRPRGYPHAGRLRYCFAIRSRRFALSFAAKIAAHPTANKPSAPDGLTDTTVPSSVLAQFNPVIVSHTSPSLHRPSHTRSSSDNTLRKMTTHDPLTSRFPKLGDRSPVRGISFVYNHLIYIKTSQAAANPGGYWHLRRLDLVTADIMEFSVNLPLIFSLSASRIGSKPRLLRLVPMIFSILLAAASIKISYCQYPVFSKT